MSYPLERVIVSLPAKDAPASASSSSAPVLDLATFLSRVDGDTALMAEVVGLFLDDKDRLLEATLERSGYDVTLAENGGRAWKMLQSEDPPRLAVLDWMMPEIDGLEVCRRTRAKAGGSYVYIIMLTARGRKEDIVEGLDAGADDYLTKPFDPHELRSRVRVSERILGLESALQTKVRELEEAIARVEQLQGLLPICMYCKKIRDNRDNWHRLEAYIQEHSEATFTHSLCSECLAEHYPHTASRPPAQGR